MFQAALSKQLNSDGKTQTNGQTMESAEHLYNMFMEVIDQKKAHTQQAFHPVAPSLVFVDVSAIVVDSPVVVVAVVCSPLL